MLQVIKNIYNWLHTVQNNISTKLIENWDRSVYKKEIMNWATILPDDLTSRTVHAGVTSDLHLRIIKMNITLLNLIVSLTFLWYRTVLLNPHCKCITGRVYLVLLSF